MEYMRIDLETFHPLFLKQLHQFETSDVKPVENFDVKPTKLTAVCSLESGTENYFKSMYKDLSEINGGELYLVPKEMLHITLIGGFDIEIGIDKFCNCVKANMPNSKMIFDLVSISSTRTNASPFALPVNFSMEKLRNEVRRCMGQYGTVYTTDYAKYIGWVNVVRYLDIPDKRVKDVYLKYVSKIWGRIEFEEVQIYKVTNKNLKKEDFVTSMKLS